MTAEHLHARLRGFLVSAFSVEQCRALLPELDETLANRVPSGGIPDEFVFALVEQLQREHRVDAQLFRTLLAERPGRRDEILALAAEFQILGPQVDPGSGRDSPLRAPHFVAEPRYIGSHPFVGRRAELDRLDDWAAPANSYPMLVFEAIGGAGKSMLTWHWTTTVAPSRGEWAGRFWYSFYEHGAVMADFCQRAVAYVTGQPLAELRRRKTIELGELLLRALQARPYLLVLDGLERVLVAYHRFDAAQIADERAGGPDPIAERDPCAAICPEDDELLRLLTSAAPSKLLMSTRLFPLALLNRSRQPIPGVVHQRLAGLRPADAEALLRACDVRGTSEAMQRYLQTHCDCHPLVTGVLAGLIHDYLPDRGEFDAWAADPQHGGRLDLGSLDLVQKRNHILHAAMAALPEKSRQLLSTLSIVSEAVDYAALQALNPHLPPEPDEVPVPEDPTSAPLWDLLESAEKARARESHAVELARRATYEAALQARMSTVDFLAAPRHLAATVRDLERRGLVQYDGAARRYDLHPVVRGVAAGGLRDEERVRYGKRVVDHFSKRPHEPPAVAAALADVSDGLHVVRALLQMGRYPAACLAFAGPLSDALRFNLEADATILSLLRPFFSRGWDVVPEMVDERMQAFLMSTAALSLEKTGWKDEGFALFVAILRLHLTRGDTRNAFVALSNIAVQQAETGKSASSARLLGLARELARPGHVSQAIVFLARFAQFRLLARMGLWERAETEWELLDGMGRDWPRPLYRSGDAEYAYAQFRLWRGDLQEAQLVDAERLAHGGKNRIRIRNLHGLRGLWWQGASDWARAADSYHEAARMAREVGQTDMHAETRLALARFHLGRLPEPYQEAERLSAAPDASDLALTELYLAIGDRERARRHAVVAYVRAWEDGEPYVHRDALTRSSALLIQLGAGLPVLAAYDPISDPPFPWEADVIAYIESLGCGCHPDHTADA